MRHDGHSVIAAGPERLGVLTRTCQMRVLNCSVSGCLIETNCRIEIGAIATVRVVIDGHRFTDEVKVVRCQLIAGAGSVYHVGALFLWTHPPDAHSLRTALWHHAHDDNRAPAGPYQDFRMSRRIEDR
jgi:hypothetical protein